MTILESIILEFSFASQDKWSAVLDKKIVIFFLSSFQQFLSTSLSLSLFNSKYNVNLCPPIYIATSKPLLSVWCGGSPKFRKSLINRIHFFKPKLVCTQRSRLLAHLESHEPQRIQEILGTNVVWPSI